jgi:hypothetical protein
MLTHDQASPLRGSYSAWQLFGNFSAEQAEQWTIVETEKAL